MNLSDLLRKKPDMTDAELLAAPLSLVVDPAEVQEARKEILKRKIYDRYHEVIAALEAGTVTDWGQTAALLGTVGEIPKPPEPPPPEPTPDPPIEPESEEPK